MASTDNRDEHDHQAIPLNRHRRRKRAPVLRLAPEYDGTELLYTNDRHPDKLFALRILAWALHADDSIAPLLPWLNRLSWCGRLGWMS